ncbi:hypothetical protein GCM10007161_17170 [Ignatzschineria indica]|uniref:Uncharacterized protein n=2 Tax=Ignatzschineria indica TaxID=472583 RepID=A0A2U2AJ21_9GAMM|nr:hypothetical protein [Ignatzschineria indica]PWD82671.1 hypothetical protein DC082_08600 [Ignatzschineria indica]GGZ86026.1 hypothetical protein GCM10007161_17170 [Ignatzschineria indica]
MVGSRSSTNFLKNNIVIDQNKKADELPEITTAYFHKLHAGKRRFPIADYFLGIKEAERCRILLSYTAINYAPAVGIEDAEWRACTGEKIEMVGSRNSTNFLKNNIVIGQNKKLMNCRRLPLRVSKNHVPTRVIFLLLAEKIDQAADGIDAKFWALKG